MAAVGAVSIALAAVGCVGQEPEEPLHTVSTDLFLVELSTVDGLPTVVGRPVNLTDRPGYDNQPSFLPDGENILYASSDGTQVDCYRYDLTTGQSVRLTDTEEREYSPTPVPGRETFSVVRVEFDGSQRLWEFDMQGQNPFLLLEWEDDVGYHIWVDSEIVALRLQQEPPELRFADADVGWVEEHAAAANVGRSLSRVPGRNAISFVDQTGEGSWWISELDLLTRESRKVVQTLPDCQDHAWLPSGALIMGQGSRLYVHRPGIDEGWSEIADLSDEPLHDISRLAVSPNGDRVVFVAERPEEVETP